MTKLTFRLTTNQNRDYVNGMITCMLADYEHGYLSGLEVYVANDEGMVHIRKGKKIGKQKKELEIPDFMKKNRQSTEKGGQAHGKNESQ